MSTTLNAAGRDTLGTRAARALRAEGRLPASIQGQGKPNADVSIGEAEFLAARRHHQSLFDIEVPGAGTETAMIREIQYDALGDRVVHVEFRRVTRGVAIETEVELVYTGHPRGGVIAPVHRTIAISAIPSKTPDVIECDVSAFSEGQTVHASDVTLPEGVSLAMDPQEPMASITGATELEPEPTEEEETAADEVPRVESERKKEEDEEPSEDD